MGGPFNEGAFAGLAGRCLKQSQEFKIVRLSSAKRITFGFVLESSAKAQWAQHTRKAWGLGPVCLTTQGQTKIAHKTYSCQRRSISFRLLNIFVETDWLNRLTLPRWTDHSDFIQQKILPAIASSWHQPETFLDRLLEPLHTTYNYHVEQKYDIIVGA